MSNFSIGGDRWPGIGKLLEEAGEVAQVCGKLIGSGGERKHWDGTDLVERLHEELGDLMAAIEFVATENKLDKSAIERRCAEKLALFREWHAGSPRVRPTIQPGAKCSNGYEFWCALHCPLTHAPDRDTVGANCGGKRPRCSEHCVT